MARPREFDVDEALQAALDAFWDRGYEATSLADLIDATGLQKGSIYKAFGSKHELFTLALERYMERALSEMQSTLEGTDSPLDGIRRWLEQVVCVCNERGARRGCFAVNTVVELGPHDESTDGRLRTHFARIERLLARTIARAQARGEVRGDRPPEELSEFLFFLARGMLASSKGAHSRASVRRSAELALSALA